MCGQNKGGLLTCGCVFAVWHWQFVSSGFVFPWERVKYPDCCPDLGEGAVRHSGQMLRFTLRQVSARSYPAPSLEAQKSSRGSACALFACAQRCQTVNNSRTGCSWNGVASQEVDVLYYLIYHMNVGQAADYHLLVWIMGSNHRSLKGSVLKLAVNQKHPSNKTDLLQTALLTQKHLHWTDCV